MAGPRYASTYSVFRIVYNMLGLACDGDSNCPFEYYCAQAICRHLPVLPLRIYPSIIYLILPFLICLTNVGGLSGGIFKVVVFMDLLNYNAAESVPLMASVNFGGALANFVLLIFRRHPYRNTSLVDFNAVYIVVPGLVLGTTIGAVLSKLLNDLVQDILLVVTCTYFAYVFIKKYIHKMRVSRKQSDETVYDMIADNQEEDEKSEERKIFDNHESGYHFRQIMITTVLFGFLLVLSIFSEGNIAKFSICSDFYGIAGFLTLVCIAVVVIGVYKLTALKKQYYNLIQYSYPIDFTRYRNFLKLFVGAIVAGVLQGVLGMGSGHMLSYILLSLGFIPEVVSGTSGFLVMYTTLATLIQQLSMNQISIDIAGMFFGLVFVVSLIGTFFLVKYLKSKADISNAILLILGGLCVMSVVGVIVNIGLTVYYFGFQELRRWRKIC